MVPATLPCPSSPTEVFTAADLDDFRVSAPGAILAMLRTLMAQRVQITLVDAAKADGASLNTQLGLIDAERAVIGFEVHAGDPQLRALLDGGSIRAVAYLERIRLQFELAAPTPLRSGEGLLLRCRLPGVLYRFQRRQAYRVRPQSRQASVHVRHPDCPEPVAARLLDLSIGGLAMQLPPELAPWPAGTCLPALVDLDRDTRFDCSLRLQYVHASDDSGTPLGCAFDKIDPPALRALQLYIDQAQKLERLLRQS